MGQPRNSARALRRAWPHLLASSTTAAPGRRTSATRLQQPARGGPQPRHCRGHLRCGLDGVKGGLKPRNGHGH
eukprot:13771880-Alexandrium_andersonii.AAC.1